jgi:hypothetical protein
MHLSIPICLNYFQYFSVIFHVRLRADAQTGRPWNHSLADKRAGVWASAKKTQRAASGGPAQSVPRQAMDAAEALHKWMRFK